MYSPNPFVLQYLTSDCSEHDAKHGHSHHDHADKTEDKGDAVPAPKKQAVDPMALSWNVENKMEE